MKHLFRLAVLLGLCLAGCCTNKGYPDGDSRYEAFSPDGIPFKVTENPWTIDLRGNHRAVVTVADSEAEGVVVRLPWRRPDLEPGTKKILVTDSADNEIKDVLVTELSSEKGELVFKPVPGEDRYYVYYLPFKWQTWYYNVSDYLAPEYEAGQDWAAKVAEGRDRLPEATVECFESVSRFQFWSPMGLIATAAEMEAVKAAAGKDMVVFTEDRAFPIQLTRQLPARWTEVPGTTFKGCAQRNEYYAWQFGIWAAGKELRNVRVAFSGLSNGRSKIGPEEMTCFNQEGTSWDGSPLEFTVNVPEGRVQALWCGVQIPEDARTGTYRGQAVVSADGVEPQTIDLEIKVTPEVLADKGDSEVWRHARLRWLNSMIAFDNEPVAPYGEMTLEGNVVEATGRKVTVGGNGMVQGATINGKEILQRPQQIIVSTSRGDVVFDASNVKIEKEAAGLVTWTASSEQEGFSFDLRGNMEYDGHLHFDIFVSAGQETEVRDVRLVTEYSPYCSEYMIGAGFGGGYTPARYSWDWTGPYDSYWIGGVLAGMHTEFRGGVYHGPLLNAFKLPPTPVWSNEGKGRVSFSGAKGQSVTVTATTGSRTIGKEPVNYEFNLMITPVKELDTKKHFSLKFFHAVPSDFDKAAEDRANIANIHHAQNLNPYINYPFIVRDSLIKFVNHEHENGRMVKIYYTFRELSAHCEELYAFHSLNHEIMEGGAGQGNPWLCEHLIEDYWPAWYTSLDHFWKGDSDPAIQLKGNSRYINYFLEGLKWVEEHYGIDGLYMDDVSCDRITVKRIRKILEATHENPLIDLHSNTWYSVGPANQYVEFFPYVDRLWFGESFKYDEMSPDQWLVTFSGIPFGVMSEMLQDGGNRFLGMVYGTTARHSWTDAGNEKSPVPMWKFWDSFGIKDARMLGYWDPECPVSTDDPEVKATAYVKDGVTAVSVGNFSGRDKTVRLTIDFAGLGIDPATATIKAPSIPNFQDETVFKTGGSISLPVGSKKGWMIVISK